MAEFIITKLERDHAGYWRARISSNGSTVPVDNSVGPWCVCPPRFESCKAALRAAGGIREVGLPERFELVAHMRRAERRAAKAAEESTNGAKGGAA